MNYWEDIDARLIKLVKEGTTRLPSLKCFDLEETASAVSHDMAGRTWMELGPTHEKFLEELNIRDNLVDRLYQIACDEFGYEGHISDQYHIARRVEPGNSAEAYRAHFDSHLFTLVIPLRIPKSVSQGPVGELVFFPNVRKRPKNETVNFLEKAYYKKFASEKGIRRFATSNPLKTDDFQDYCPLIFMGNTTLHTNKEVSMDCSGYRLTLLAHFFDPSHGFGIGHLLRFLRSR